MDSHDRDLEIRKIAFSNQKIAAQMGRRTGSEPSASSIYATILSRQINSRPK